MSRQLFGVLLVVSLASAAASATVVVPAGFNEIVNDATLIVRGHVTDVRGVVEPRTGIESVAAIAVDATIKGGARDFVSIRVPGGTVGRIRSRMIGAPVLRIGQHAVFFLKRDASNAWRPVGLSMGIYRVAADSAGIAVVNPPPVAGETADEGRVIRGDRRRTPMPVSSFESLVRLVMAGQAGLSRQGRR